MKDCVCCQCSDWPPGDAPEYFQCEGCRLYGTSDEFPDNETYCEECHRDRQQGAAEQAVENERERSAFTMTLLRDGK
jgi:hypothetical protein